MRIFKLVLFTLLLAACGHHDNFDKVKAGMKEDEVIKLMGEPTKKHRALPNVPITMWYYGDNRVVVVENGQVANVVPDVKAALDSMAKVMETMDKQLDTLTSHANAVADSLSAK